MVSFSCQAFDHDPNHTNPQHRLAVIQPNFIVTAKSARLVEPAERPFDDPPSRQHLEPFERVTPAHNLQPQFTKGPQVLDPGHQGPQVTAVGPDELQTAIHTDQQLDQGL